MWQMKENRDMKTIMILTWIITMTYIYVLNHIYETFDPTSSSFPYISQYQI